MASDSRMPRVRSASNARFIVDAEGDIHADSGSGTANTGTGYLTYDAWDDAELIRTLEIERRGPGLIETESDEFLGYGRADLERAGIARFNDHEGGDGSVFVNYSALTRLLCGAVWQSTTRIRHLETRLNALQAGGTP